MTLVVVVLLLLLSKPDSVSLKSTELVYGHWRLKSLRWLHSWLVADSTLELVWGFVLDAVSL